MEARACTLASPATIEPTTPPVADALGSADRAGRPARLRIALITTPRTGNNWLRRLLATSYGITHIAAPNPEEIPWASLPTDCLVGIHWHRTPTFEKLLREHGFQVVVLSRHPLDVLISILHFALHDGSTARWLEGEGGDERCIYGAMPCSAAFVEYATGRRAAALMSVSRDWWSAPGVHRVCYERLVADTEAEMARLLAAIGVNAVRPLSEVVAENTILQLRKSTGYEHHFWQGKSGLWKRLIPLTEGAEIAWAVQKDLATFGYEYDPDPGLNRRQADANWIELNRPELTRKLNEFAQARIDLAEAQKRLALSEADRAALQTHLDQWKADSVLWHAERSSLLEQLTTAQKKLAELGEVGPQALRVAHALRRCSMQFPSAATWIKRLVRMRRAA